MTDSYRPVNKVRFVTATSLFDGHDASINIFRRMLQASGAEVIHLGHNRSGLEIVDTAIQEDAQAIAVTSYQGGHMEFFRYLRDLLVERDAEHIRLFGGGGGTILPDEGAELMEYGVTRIYSPDDGRSLGLQGMVEDMLAKADFPTGAIDGVSVSYDTWHFNVRGSNTEPLIRLNLESVASPEEMVAFINVLAPKLAALSQKPTVLMPDTSGWTKVWEYWDAAVADGTGVLGSGRAVRSCLGHRIGRRSGGGKHVPDGV